MMEVTKLTTTVTVKQYREFKKSGDQEKIANLIYERFFERYIEPFEDNKSKHGFSMMAVSCLMIETLYCFQNGQKRTVGPGGDVFEKFFSDSIHLKEFVGFGREFYSKIRCGILHQGETYGGWKILRKGAIFVQANKTINATKFMKALKDELREFTGKLKSEHLSSKIWKNVIKKLDYICMNCIP